MDIMAVISDQPGGTMAEGKLVVESYIVSSKMMRLLINLQMPQAVAINSAINDI